MNDDEPLFLDVDDVLEIHATQREVVRHAVDLEAGNDDEPEGYRRARAARRA